MEPWQIHASEERERKMHAWSQEIHRIAGMLQLYGFATSEECRQTARAVQGCADIEREQREAGVLREHPTP